MPKSESRGLLIKTLEKHPRVLAYDNEGTDEGYVMITTVKGYAFEDAAKNVGDDPEARMAAHSRTCRGVKDALFHLRLAAPCRCGRCEGTF